MQLCKYFLTAYCSHMWQSLAPLRSSGLSSIAVSLMCVALGNSTGTFKLGCFPFLQTSNPRGECSSQPQPAISLASRLRPAPRLSPVSPLSLLPLSCTIYFEYCEPVPAVVASTASPSDDLHAATQVVSVPCVPLPASPPNTPLPLTMAMVNMNNLLNGKDSRWLQLEVCREFQRNKCSRPDTECKFAHPPANVEVQNGRVTACYDSIKVGLTFTSSRLVFIVTLLSTYSGFLVLRFYI